MKVLDGLRDGCQNGDVSVEQGRGAGNDLKTRITVLDACCGTKAFWFEKNDPRVLFVDKRAETHVVDIGTPGTIGRAPLVIDPDILASYSDLPFPDASFSLVVLDPPHIARLHAKGVLTKKYGILCGDWRDMLRRGFSECFRVLKAEGTLIFKWAESSYPVSEVLRLTDQKPLFGHRSGRTTHWVVFMKDANAAKEDM